MKNFQNYTPEKYSEPDFQMIEEGIYQTKCPYETIFNSEIFVTSLTFEMEPECYGEEDASPRNLTQVPIEGILDEFNLFVTDFYEQLYWGSHHFPDVCLITRETVQFMISQKNGKPARIYDGEYPLTGILKCLQCGAGMVISRTTNRNKDGSKRRITYYACGNWKNKGTTVCHSNMVRVEKANTFVYHQLDKLLSDEKFFKEVVSRVNREHRILKENAIKERGVQEKSLEKIRVCQQKNHELYEDGEISKEEFLSRREELNRQLCEIREKQTETSMVILEEGKKEIPKETIREIL